MKTKIALLGKTLRDMGHVMVLYICSFRCQDRYRLNDLMTPLRICNAVLLILIEIMAVFRSYASEVHN